MDALKNWHHDRFFFWERLNVIEGDPGDEEDLLFAFFGNEFMRE